MRWKPAGKLESLESRDLPSSGLTVVVTTNHRVYHTGQAVVLTLTETNTTNHDIKVFRTSTLGGFTVSQKGRELWKSDSPIQPMFAYIETLHPGESITQTATWHGEHPEGSPAHPLGPFMVKAAAVTARPVVVRFVVVPHGN
jgi:hypothetical protein